MRQHLVVALDLEMNQPSGKIIQIGAVVGDVGNGTVEDRFSTFCNPNELLSTEIVELTGITQANVDQAPALPEAFGLLCQWLAPYQRRRHTNPVTWGGGDTELLLEQIGLEYGDERWPFGRRWLDTKTLFAALLMRQGKSVRVGLAGSMKKAGLVFEGRAHDALVDAENTFRFWAHLVARINP